MEGMFLREMGIPPAVMDRRPCGERRGTRGLGVRRGPLGHWLA